VKIIPVSSTGLSTPGLTHSAAPTATADSTAADASLSILEEIVQIDDAGRLFLSGAIHDWSRVHALGITVVIDLEGDIDHGVPTAADQFLYIYLPIHDGNLPQLDRLHAVARMAAELITNGHRVLSHCGMGLNRSALMAGLICLCLGNTTGPDCVELLQRKRPGALYNTVFADYLRTMECGDR